MLICLLLLTINFSGKRLNPSFPTREVTDHKLNSIKKNEVLQDNDLIAKELNELFKNAASTLNIKKQIHHDKVIKQYY